MEFLPGAFAGLTSVILGYPFDTIKTRMQLNNKGNTSKFVFNLIKNEGSSSLYRGVSVPLITTIIKRSYQYRIFEKLKEQKNSPFLSGGIAGVSGTLLGCPMHVIKSQMQSTNKNEIKNTFDLIKKISKKEGFIGFYRGFKINLFKDFIFGSCYLGSYTYLKKTFIPNLLYSKKYSKLNDKQEKVINFLSGGLASTITWGTLIPIDHLETAIQTKQKKNYVLNKLKTNNIFILWRGSIPILLRIFPVSAISMSVYEISNKYIKLI